MNEPLPPAVEVTATRAYPNCDDALLARLLREAVQFTNGYLNALRERGYGVDLEYAYVEEDDCHRTLRVEGAIHKTETITL